MLYVANAFSLGMLPKGEHLVEVSDLSDAEVRSLLTETEFVSIIGHEATAQVMTRLLGIHIPFQRKAIQLQAGDKVLVFQIGLRLPQGSLLTETELQEIISRNLHSWRLVEVLK